MENHFARLNQINVSDHIEKKGEFSLPILAVRGRPAAAGRPRRLLGGAALRRAAISQDRDGLPSSRSPLPSRA